MIHWAALEPSVKDFFRYKALKLSASLAFFTFFSLPSLLVLAISAGGYLLGVNEAKGRIFGQMGEWLGKNASMQVQEVIKGMQISDQSGWTTWFAIAFLVITANGIIAEIRDSFRTLYDVSEKKEKSLQDIVQGQAITLFIVVVSGIALTLSLSINWWVIVFSEYIKTYLPTGALFLITLSNYACFALIFIGVATFIYRFLPEKFNQWRAAFHGAVLATGLLVIGKWLLSVYLKFNPILSAYTAASSLILVLIWVYYMAMVLYFGALYTKHVKKFVKSSKPRAVNPAAPRKGNTGGQSKNRMKNTPKQV